MRTETIGYRAFLLRVWTRPEGGDARASIRDVETGETHAFDDLDRLREWLGAEICTTSKRRSTVTNRGTQSGAARVTRPRVGDDADTLDGESGERD